MQTELNRPGAGHLTGPLRVETLGPLQLDAVARVHVAAFPDSALSQLGLEVVRRYYEWQLTAPRNDSLLLGVIVDGELGGFCVGGVFRGKMSGYLRQHRTFLIWQLARRPWLLARGNFRDRIVAGLRIVKVLPSPKASVPLYQDSDPNSFGILSIAVDPRRQGLGLGRLLMDEAERLARQRGFGRMNLSVKVSNDRAIRFYEGLHWQRRIGADAIWNGEMIKWLRN